MKHQVAFESLIFVILLTAVHFLMGPPLAIPSTKVHRIRFAEPERKRKKTAKDKSLRPAELPQAVSDAPWRLRAAQPWANKAVKAATLTQEQKEYMALVEKKKADEAAATKGGGTQVCPVSKRKICCVREPAN
jgi:hypothetical protein